MNDPVSRTDYIYCDGGRHLTGAMTAIYRMTAEGWDQKYSRKVPQSLTSECEKSRFRRNSPSKRKLNTGAIFLA
jgi:hypothetical protein